MKRLTISALNFSLALGLSIAMTSSSAHASRAPAGPVTLSVDPSAQDVLLGIQAAVDIRISDLGNLGPPSLSVFDLDISFDPSIVLFSGVTFGDPGLGDQLDIFGFGSFTSVVPGVGTVNLSELSLESSSDLDTLQAGEFILFSLTFDSLALGTSPIAIASIALGDSLGSPLPAFNVDGSITVIPEPGATALLTTALGLLAMGRRRRRTTIVCEPGSVPDSPL